MKFKLIRSIFDEQTGLSSVTIATDLGFFTGYAQLHEDDKAVASSFCGCRYAELRAIQKYVKKRVSLYAYKLQALNNYLSYIKSRSDFKESECKKLYKYINHIKKERDTWKKKDKSLTNAIIKNINERDKALEKLNIK